jgi:hypothetical protein
VLPASTAPLRYLFPFDLVRPSITNYIDDLENVTLDPIATKLNSKPKAQQHSSHKPLCHTTSKAATCSSQAAPRKYLRSLSRPFNIHVNVANSHGNSGLGALISTTFAQQGCNVAINYFNRLEPAQKVQKECEGFGVNAVLVKAVRLPLLLFSCYYLRWERIIVLMDEFVVGYD